MTAEPQSTQPGRALSWGLPPAAPLAPLEEASPQELAAVAAPPAGEVDVINWRLADPDLIAAQFEPLREFVDWMIQVYSLQGSVVPPCWPRHPALVQELYALYAIHGAAFIEGDPGAGPLGWAERFAMARHRLRDIVSESRCTARQHEAAREQPALTALNEYWYDVAAGDVDWLTGKTLEEEA